MKEKVRVHLAPERKYEIVKEAIMGKNTVSELCKQHGIGTGQYYRWQQMFFDGAIQGLRHTKSGRKNSAEEKLKEENERLKSVITDLASENLKLKKSFGI